MSIRPLNVQLEHLNSNLKHQAVCFGMRVLDGQGLPVCACACARVCVTLSNLLCFRFDMI
jgi:hypothetical protein